MATIPANPDGWMIKVPMLGMEPDTRPMDELYAVWVSDPVDACRRVEEAAQLTNDRIPETHAELSVAQLRGLNLEKAGDVRLVQAVL